jgi:hypothetical protein
MTRWKLRRRDDEGAMLIFALLITTTIALVVGVVLTRGDGSLRATVTLRDVAGTSYAADAAGNIAINNLRTGYGFTSNPSGFDNALGGKGCFGGTLGADLTDTLALNGFYPATGTVKTSSAFVECTGEAGTGQQGSPVPINDSNKPGYAIVTLGDAGTHANGHLTASDALKVHGGIYADGDIIGPVSVDAGDVRATGSCSATTVTGTATKTCGGVGPVDDPNYNHELGSTVPVLQTPPTTCSGGVATFTPGYYDSAKELNDAMALPCRVMWFKPGNYYFDFHDEACTDVCPDGVYPDITNVWSVPRGTDVLGGTPTNPTTGAVLAKPPSPLPTDADGLIPGNCQSPITDVNAQGVQFVFGGNSRMFLNGNGSTGAHMELCASYHSDRPPIELYGLKTGSTPSAVTDTGRDISNGGSVVSAGAFTGATVANLKGGGPGATWKTTTANQSSSILKIDGFQPSRTVPTGSIVTQATLHVTHTEPATGANFAGNAKLTIGAWSLSTAITATTSTTTTDIPITGTNLTDLQKAVRLAGYTGATVEYTANAKQNNATTTVGPITLDLKYFVPVLRGESGTCIATGTSCPLLSTDPSGNNKINMYLQGTTYAPLADLSIVLSNFSAEVAKFGVIARRVEFDVNTGNPRYTGPVFEIPDNSPGYGYNNTTVHLKVHVCLGKPTCSASDPVSLTARVQVWDPTGVPVPPKRQVTILSWSHQR